MTAFVLKNVTAAYGEQIVLYNFSTVLKKGEAVILWGPSGCGKTTLLRLLQGLKKPKSGIVEGAGRWACGTVFQEDRLCEQLSALQNLRPVCPQLSYVRQHLQELGLSDEDTAKPVSQLSGGQRRRVALARAVLFPSDFLLLDEPFKGLDEATRQAAMQYVRRHQEGRGLILVTHDKTEAVLLGERQVELQPLQMGTAACGKPASDGSARSL